MSKKFDNGNNSRFGLSNTPFEFTIPFNLHIVDDTTITNSIQPIVNNTPDVNRNTQITHAVKEMLNIMVHLLNTAPKAGKIRMTRKRKVHRRISKRKGRRSNRR